MAGWEGRADRGGPATMAAARAVRPLHGGLGVPRLAAMLLLIDPTL